MSFHVDDDIKLFEKYKTIWNKIEILQNIKLDNFKKNFMVQKKTKKKTIKIREVNVDNIFISKLIETKTISILLDV